MLNQTNPIDKSEGNGENSRLKTQLLRLHLIRCDAGTQSRAAINEEVVSDYAERMLDGIKFPPVAVFFDGNQYYLADGFHRVMAANRNGFLDFECNIRPGTRADALQHSLGANAGHGLRRTNADKRRSVELAFAEWPQLSDREIARICAVSHEFARLMRSKQVSTVDTSQASPRIGRDGKQYRVRQPEEHEQPNDNQVRESEAESQLVTVTTSDPDDSQLSSDDSSAPAESQTELTDDQVRNFRTCRSAARTGFNRNSHNKPQCNGSRAPALDSEDDCIEAMGLTEGEPEELRARTEYHMELIKADMDILLDRLCNETLEPEDILAVAKELKLAVRIFTAYADTLTPSSQD